MATLLRQSWTRVNFFEPDPYKLSDPTRRPRPRIDQYDGKQSPDFLSFYLKRFTVSLMC